MKAQKIFILALTISLLLNAQIVNDTLLSVGELDGDIHYWYNQNWYLISTGSLDLIIGDGRDWDGYLNFSRAFISFDISQYNDADSFESAFIELYMYYSRGNDTVGVFPTFFDRPIELVPCIFDHVIYGDSLEWEDWTAGDPDDPKTITSNIGSITNSPNYEWKSIDVTENIRADILGNRPLSQYRIRFTIDHDDDGLVDNLAFASYETHYWNGQGPRLIISPGPNISVIDDPFPLPESIKLNCYPNPFNSQITINITLPVVKNSEVQIYNIRGDLIRILALDKNSSEAINVLTWNGLDDFGRNVSSGVYFVTLHSKQNSLSRKILLIK